MMVQARFTNGLCKFVQAKDLKIAANGLLYMSVQHNIFVVDEVLGYACID